MSSPYSDRAGSLISEIMDIFEADFDLLPEFEYNNVAAGERYGLIEFQELSADMEMQSTDIFKVFKGEILLTFGYDSERDAKKAFVGLALDLDNFCGTLKRTLSSGYDLLYDFKIQGDISRALRQPLVDPGVWIMDATATAIARIAIPKDKEGIHEIRVDHYGNPTL